MSHMRATSTVFLVAVTLAACGNDGDKAQGGQAAAAATKAAATATPVSQFIAEAEAICKEANEKESAAGATGIDWIYSDLFMDQKFLKEFTAVGRSALDRLRKLTPPAEDRAQFKTALGAIDKMLGGLEKQLASLRTGKDSGNALETYEHGYTDLVAAGGPIGLTECLEVVL